MIREDLKRITGLFSDDEGDMAAVWLALDADTGRIRVYDCAIWRDGEVLAVLAESLGARGRWIPVAWDNEPLAQRLKREFRCTMLPEKTPDSHEEIEMAYRDLQQRMRARVFTVDAHCVEWIREFQRFEEFGSRKIPTEGFPLMTATRIAMQNLKRARAQSVMRPGKSENYPKKLAIV